MRKLIYLVRHGESQSNAGGVSLAGETPLTLRGLQQAHFIAERASKLPIEVIISSTMLRAKQTAASIADITGKNVETSDLLRSAETPLSGMEF